MRTTKGTPWRMGLWGVVAGAVLMLGVRGAGAHATGACTNSTDCEVASDRAASIVIFPKIVVDTNNGVDTVIQLTHAGNRRSVDVECYWVNANGHCSISGDICGSGTLSPRCDTGERCLPGWEKRDFRLTLTKRQPVSWKASEGTSFLPCDPVSPDLQLCAVDDQGQPIFNSGSVPPVQEDPFVGELKCIQVDESDAPVDFNDLKGEATVIRTLPGELGVFDGRVDVAKYNAVGMQAIPGQNNGDRTLCIGGEGTSSDCPTGMEYAGCAQTLIMNHFFDDAVEGGAGSQVISDLTLVPCGQDLEIPANNAAAVTPIQFLIFNEFEQRTSTSFRISCFEERQLSDIDTRLGDFDNSSSIFNVSVQGTLTGQSRLRPVSTNGEARGFIGLVEEFHDCSNGPAGACTADFNLHQQGRRPLGDIIKLP